MIPYPYFHDNFSPFIAPPLPAKAGLLLLFSSHLYFLSKCIIILYVQYITAAISVFKEVFMKKERRLELDIIKGLALCFMFLVHCYENYGTPAIQHQGFFSYLVFFLGGPLAAPVFMFCMGIGMVYTSKQTSRHFIHRGIYLFLLGYALNFFRDFIPYTILICLHNDTSLKKEALDYLVCIDILPFAGLAYLFMGLFKWSRLNDYFLLLFYAVCAVANVILLPIQFDERILGCTTGLVWGSWSYTWFPFLSWIFFPIAGYLFGKQLKHCTDLDSFYKKIMTWSALFFLPLLLIVYGLKIDYGVLDSYVLRKYYQMNWFGNFIIFDIILLWISFWYFASENLPNILKKPLVNMSKQINTVYVVQWLCIGYGLLVFGECKYHVLEVLLLYVFTLATVNFIVFFILPKCKPSKWNKQKA